VLNDELELLDDELLRELDELDDELLRELDELELRELELRELELELRELELRELELELRELELRELELELRELELRELEELELDAARNKEFTSVLIVKAFDVFTPHTCGLGFPYFPYSFRKYP
jgi:uncharacterized protein YhdP